MANRDIIPTKVERFFDKDNFIVSKTDVKGRITYANRYFCEVAGYTEREILGQAHSIVRHPDMPRSVFKLLWDTILDGREIFAYVKNMAKNGDYYWVYAHVTPSYDAAGQMIGFHSNRRVPERRAIERIAPVYAALLREEQSHKNGKDALVAGCKQLEAFVQSQKTTYDQLVFSL
jgi:PAS domain S-box-containing protein